MITLKYFNQLFAWMLLTPILTLVSAAAYATDEGGDSAYKGAYIGSGIGISNWKSSASTNNYTSTGLNIIGGYQFNQVLALEAEYFDLGIINVPVPTIAGNPNASIKATGAGLSVVILFPLNNGKLDFYGKMGLASITTSVTAPTGYFFTIPSSDTGTSMTMGIGLNFNYSRNAILKLTINQYECSVPSITNTHRVDIYGIAGTYHF